MATTTLSAQEIERVVVFQYAESFPLFEDDGRTLAYIIDPTTGKIVDRAYSMDAAQSYILHEGMIAYAVATAPDEEGEEPYWTQERAQRLYDTNRRQYVDCWNV